jgi:hypothetical protein
MTNRETVHRNLELTFDFVKHLIDKPELIKDIPDKFELEFFDKDFSAKSLKSSKKNGRRKTFVKVKSSFEFVKS